MQARLETLKLCKRAPKENWDRSALHFPSERGSKTRHSSEHPSLRASALLLPAAAAATTAAAAWAGSERQVQDKKWTPTQPPEPPPEPPSGQGSVSPYFPPKHGKLHRLILPKKRIQYGEAPEMGT